MTNTAGNGICEIVLNLQRIASKGAVHYYTNSLWGLVMALAYALECLWPAAARSDSEAIPKVYVRKGLIPACSSNHVQIVSPPVCVYLASKFDLLSCGQ